MPEKATEFEYRAFIAFDKTDAPWADDIETALDGVQVPAQLVGSETPFGPAPENLRPIFRRSDSISEGQQAGLDDEAAAALHLAWQSDAAVQFLRRQQAVTDDLRAAARTLRQLAEEA